MQAASSAERRAVCLTGTRGQNSASWQGHPVGPKGLAPEADPWAETGTVAELCPQRKVAHGKIFEARQTIHRAGRWDGATKRKRAQTVHMTTLNTTEHSHKKIRYQKADMEMLKSTKFERHACGTYIDEG